MMGLNGQGAFVMGVGTGADRKGAEHLCVGSTRKRLFSGLRQASPFWLRVGDWQTIGEWPALVERDHRLEKCPR
jgi:hypothetical protein